MNPNTPNALLDGTFKFCWQGVEWTGCFARGGTRSPDIEEREFDANCGTIKKIKKTKSINFSFEFTSWNCNHLGLLAPHLANGDALTTNGIVTTTQGCSTSETTGPLYVELECADSCNTLYYPNATINILEEDIDFTDDGGVVVSVSFEALPAANDSAYPGVIEVIGQPDSTTAQVYDCATETWVAA